MEIIIGDRHTHKWTDSDLVLMHADMGGKDQREQEFVRAKCVCCSWVLHNQGCQLSMLSGSAIQD